MSFLDHKSFERTLAEHEANDRPVAGAADPKPPSGRRLPLWLVDPKFDEAMRRNGQSVVQADERLPLRTRAAILAALIIVTWVPILALGALIWR